MKCKKLTKKAPLQKKPGNWQMLQVKLEIQYSRS